MSVQKKLNSETCYEPKQLISKKESNLKSSILYGVFFNNHKNVSKKKKKWNEENCIHVWV